MLLCVETWLNGGKMKRRDAIHIRLPGERFTPFSLLKKLNAKAILESASFTQGRARYSILLLEEAFRLMQDNSGIYFLHGSEKKRLEQSHFSPPENRQAPYDILDLLSYIANQNEPAQDGIPLPGSGIGYISYEFVQRTYGIDFSGQKDDLGMPESLFIVGHIYLIFDHFKEIIHIIGLNYNESEIDLEKKVFEVKERIENLDFTYLAKAESKSDYRILTNIDASKKEYCKNVFKIKDLIREGEVVQAVPSRRLEFESELDALEAYRRLRSLNPSPYMFYIDFSSFQLIGASPESVVRVENGFATIRPIAGTKKRGKNRDEDEMQKELLENDPKEKAEHLMLVDLARGDLSRVCVPGTVELSSFQKPEFYSHVIHLVSEVRGKLDKNIHSTDVFRATFPAGTVSGSPKKKVMELISKLESSKRNFYAGAVGYMQSSGDLDFCIAIRSALKQGKIWTMQAGGGIVFASDEEREWEETNEKLSAFSHIFETTDIK